MKIKLGKVSETETKKNENCASTYVDDLTQNNDDIEDAMSGYSHVAKGDEIPCDTIAEKIETANLPFGMSEDKSKRTASSKHYLMPNGNYKAVMCAQNIHYYCEEEKAFRSIDNALIEAVADASCDFNGLETRYNDFKVRMAKDTAGEKLVCVCKAAYKIYWSLLDEENSNEPQPTNTRRYNRNAVAAIQGKRCGEEADEFSKLTSEVIYHEAYENADLQYVIQGASLKENIILKQAGGNYKFGFKLKTENLSVKLSSDKQKIEFCFSTWQCARE